VQVDRDPYYDLPLVRHDSLDTFDPSPYPLAIHEIPVGGLVLTAMIRLAQSRYLPVICHGAVDRAQKRLPFFQRVTTSLERPGPFVLFADPVLPLNPSISLAWFVGTAQTDITPAMVTVVDRVREITGIDHVSFQGTSGGGFASLQLASRVPGSLAYVWAPQTVIPHYYPRHVEEFLRVAFEGMTPEEALARFPQRLSCLERYRGRPLTNFIYYVQNTEDSFHVARHFRPFVEAIGAPPVDGLYLDGRVRLVEVDLGPGHKWPSQANWDKQIESALAMVGIVSEAIPSSAETN
jgi:hypothetical protein